MNPRKLLRLAGLAALLALPFTLSASNIGYISWNAHADEAGSFDIVNLSGPTNSFPPDFPVVSTVTLSNLLLQVTFTDGVTQLFGPGYFSLSIDGLSLDGTPIPTLSRLPVTAILTGTFSTTSILLDGGGLENISPSFSASIASSSGPALNSGDLALIVTMPPSSAVPEPGAGWLAGGGFVLLLLASRRLRCRNQLGAAAAAVGLALALPGAGEAVSLAPATSPSSGVAGYTVVNVTAGGVPLGTIRQSNVRAQFASSCGGSGLVTVAATGMSRIVGLTWRFSFLLPQLPPGTYYLQVSDTAASDVNFTSTNCAAVVIIPPTISKCSPGGSIGISAGTMLVDGVFGQWGPSVTAYVPRATWEGGETGVYAVTLESSSSTQGTPETQPATLLDTTTPVSSCTSDPSRGTVCTGNNNEVYVFPPINATTTGTSGGPPKPPTAFSGADTFANFIGGQCINCGVVMDARAGKAYVIGGYTGAASGQGLQSFDLSSLTFGPPRPTANKLTQNVAIDPTRQLILTPNDRGRFDMIRIEPNGSFTELSGPPTPRSNNNLHAAIDCSTGVAISTQPARDIFLINLDAAMYTPTSFTAPNSTFFFANQWGNSTRALAVEPSGSHLGVATADFGGESFTVFRLPAVAGTGAPTVVDYATAGIPGSPACGNGGTLFDMGRVPHSLSIYRNPVNHKTYAVFAGYQRTTPRCLARVDLEAVLAAPRGGSGWQPNDVAPANLPASAITYYPFERPN